jgi:hypothetical protein
MQGIKQWGKPVLGMQMRLSVYSANETDCVQCKWGWVHTVQMRLSAYSANEALEIQRAFHKELQEIGVIALSLFPLSRFVVQFTNKVAARCREQNYFANSNIAVKGSNPTRSIDICLRCFSALVVLCMYRPCDLAEQPFQMFLRIM